MPDNNKNEDLIEAEFLRSLRQLEKLGDEGVKEEPKASFDPIDAHEYVDPEQRHPEVYDKMVSEIERKRAERKKSIWSDEPVVPVKKSVWLDDDDTPAPRPERRREERSGLKKTEFDLRLSEGVRNRMREQTREESPAPAEEAPRRRVRPEGEEPVRRRKRPRPAEEQVPSRVRQRPAEEQVPSRVRQRPAEEQTSSRVRQRPAEEQTSSRVRQRAETSPAPERRRRRKKPKFRSYETEFSFLNAAVCILMVFGIGISLVVVTRNKGKIESENRMAAEFPKFSLSEYFSGRFTEGIVNYYTDTIPDRESLKGFSSTFSNLFGINIDNYAVHGDVHETPDEKIDSEMEATATKATIYTGQRSTTAASTGGKTLDPDNTETVTEAETIPLETITKDVVPEEGEWAGNVVMADKGTPNVRAMPVFYGLFENGDRYASILSNYKKMVGETVNVFSMQIPLASAYYMPKNLEGTGSDQHEYLKYVNLSLKGVIGVDVYDALKSHADEYIYSRTDHHWQPLGAYYAAKVFAEEAGVPFADLSTYEKCKIDDFCGTMYAYSKYDPDLKKWPDTFWYYKPKNQYTIDYYNDTFSAIDESKGHSLFFDWVSGSNCYSAILGGDLDIPEIKTDVHNGRTLVVIKDSYGNAMIPFLTQSFEKIYVVDFRYVNIGMRNFFKKVGATDILFGLSISGSYTYSHINTIEQIMG